MHSNRALAISFAGIVVGSVTYYLAEWWAARSVESGQVIGANIGAGIVGLLGIAVGIVSLGFFLAAIVKRW